MNIVKQYEFFKPESCTSRIHIVGCGSVGSTIAENLARCGMTKFTLWDFDKVESHNISNQMFKDSDIGRQKTEALKDLIVSINPDAESSIEIKNDGWKDALMSGIIFLCVDSIEIRRDIVEKHMNSPFVQAVFDVRTMLTGAQHYAADWSSAEQKKNLIATMQFTHEEAAAETPTSACGITLGVVTTVRLVSAYAVNNFIKFVKGEPIWTFMMLDGFSGNIDCM